MFCTPFTPFVLIDSLFKSSITWCDNQYFAFPLLLLIPIYTFPFNWCIFYKNSLYRNLVSESCIRCFSTEQMLPTEWLSYEKKYPVFVSEKFTSFSSFSSLERLNRDAWVSLYDCLSRLFFSFDLRCISFCVTKGKEWLDILKAFTNVSKCSVKSHLKVFWMFLLFSFKFGRKQHQVHNSLHQKEKSSKRDVTSSAVRL